MDDVVKRLDEIILRLDRLLVIATLEPGKPRKFFESLATGVTIGGLVAIVAQILDWLK
jgi:hypothetical protein